MKKNLIIFLLGVIVCHFSFSQVQFQSLSFEQALHNARTTGKLIFLQFESVACDQCNEVADKAFEDQKLGNQLNQGFICIKINSKSPDRKNVANTFDIEKFFGTLFISANGALVHNFPKTISLAASYSKEIDKALTKAGEGMRLSELEKLYNSDPKNIFLLEQLLLLRKSLYLNTDSLLDEYVSLLPTDSLLSGNTLAFIAKQYPVIGSRADIMMRKNDLYFNKAWYTISLPDRIHINNRILYKSMRKAISGKNLDYAYRVASFARNTHNGNPSGAKVYDSNILDYYREIHDTLNYLARVVNYYDNYYMTINADSIKKRDSMSLLMIPRQGNEKAIPFAPMTQTFTHNLNEGARAIYTWSNNPLYLKKALQWAERANEFYESPDAIDTYARLLYKTGRTNEAIQQEIKAIELKKKRGYKATQFEIVLANMKAGKNPID